MKDSSKQYNPAMVRALLNVWPQIEGAIEKGVVLINPGVYRNNVFEDRVAAEELEGLVPAPSSRRNSPYRIDNAGCLYLDICEALDNAITPQNKKRILQHYLYGYEYKEIADHEGDSSEGSVKLAVKRSIEKMAKWLESPKGSVEADKRPRDLSYKRKFTSYPQFSMN